MEYFVLSTLFISSSGQILATPLFIYSSDQMAIEALTTEAIALTEKKMDMTLDDIIKMSKGPTDKGKKAPRHFIKHQGFMNRIVSQRGNKVQRFMDSRSSIRQGVLAKRRSNFHVNGNLFPLTSRAAKRAAIMPARNMNVLPARNTAGNWKNKPWFAPVNAQRKVTADGVAVKSADVVHQTQGRPQTMDALFANMKEKRMMVFSSQQQSLQGYNRSRFRGRQQRQQARGGVMDGPFPGGRFVGPFPGG